MTFRSQSIAEFFDSFRNLEIDQRFVARIKRSLVHFNTEKKILDYLNGEKDGYALTMPVEHYLVLRRQTSLPDAAIIFYTTGDHDSVIGTSPLYRDNICADLVSIFPREAYTISSAGFTQMQQRFYKGALVYSKAMILDLVREESLTLIAPTSYHKPAKRSRDEEISDKMDLVMDDPGAFPQFPCFDSEFIRELGSLGDDQRSYIE